MNRDLRWTNLNLERHGDMLPLRTLSRPRRNDDNELAADWFDSVTLLKPKRLLGQVEGLSTAGNRIAKKFTVRGRQRFYAIFIFLEFIRLSPKSIRDESASENPA